jgi:hypothetical protein
MTGRKIEIRESTRRYAKRIPLNKPKLGRHRLAAILIEVVRGEKEEI